MSLRTPAFGFLAISTCCLRASAQSALPSTAIGTWRGTSLCTVRPSSCHDERVVYRVTPLASRDSASFDARKIVNGQEEEMGVLRCVLTASRTKLACTMPNGVWRFEVRGDSLVGDLRVANDIKFRDVRTARSP